MSLPDSLGYFAAFLVGLAGSPHCIGMCGGIVSLFNLAGRREATQTIGIPMNLAFQAGRVSCYALLGAAGGAGAGLLLGDRAWVGVAFRWVSLFLLVSIALSILGWWSPGKYLEKTGAVLWSKVQRLARPLLPVRSAIAAYGLGITWGFLPCGLIYSALAWSLTSGSALQASLMMFCFGVGTMPALLGVGAMAGGIKQQMRRPAVRYSLAIFLVALALLPFQMQRQHSEHQPGHDAHHQHR